MRKKIIARWADKWKFHGDMAVVAIPLMIAAVENAPDLNHKAAYWVIQSLSVALALFNLGTKAKQNP